MNIIKKLVKVFGILILFFCFFMRISSQAAEVNDLSVKILDSSHKKCSVQVQTSDNELFGKQVKVYTEDSTGHVLGSASVSFSEAKQECEISFDRIVKAEETIYVYAEKGNGDTSPVETKTLSACRHIYYNPDGNLGPKGIMGNYKYLADPGGTIEVTISDTVYTGRIDAEGDYKISFGEKMYMPGLTATIVVKCCGGCIVSEDTVTIKDKFTRPSMIGASIDIYPHYVKYHSYSNISSSLREELVFYVEVDGCQYNSKESYVTLDNDSDIYLKFNTVLETGKTANVWMENDVTGQKSDYTLSRQVGELPFSISEDDIYPYESYMVVMRSREWWKKDVPVTLHISDETGVLDIEGSSVGSYMYETMSQVDFPTPKKEGTVLTFWLTDALGGSSPKITKAVKKFWSIGEAVEDGDYDNTFYDSSDDYGNTFYDSSDDYGNTLSGYSEIDTIYYGSGKVTGCTLAGTKVTVTIKGKKYTKTVKKKGRFMIKIPVKKIGTKVKIVFSNKNKTKKDYTLNRKICNKTVNIRYYNLYQNKTTLRGYIKGASKGDKLVVTIGGKKYTKKIKSNAKKVNYSFRIKPKRAGSKITLAVYNKFGQKRRKCKSRVYLSNMPKVGMTKAQVRLTTIGSPTRINKYGSKSANMEQWVYEYSDGIRYLYFRNGKYVSYSEYMR